MTSVPTIILGEIMVSKAGSVDPSKYPEEAFDLYSIPAFDSGEPEIVDGKMIGSTKQPVRSGDVLLSKIVPHIRRSWVVKEMQGRRQIGSSEWIVFRDERCYPGYLRHMLVSDPFHTQLMQTVSGVGGSLLRARPSHVANIKMPLPSMSEQQRIAEILDRTEALRAKRREALAKLDTLAQVSFLDMFGDPVTNSMGWPEGALLGDVAEIVSGVTVGRKLNGKESQQVPYLAVSNVQDHFLNLSVIKTIDATLDEVERYRLKRNDLLVTEGGDPDKLGRGTLWNNELPECIHQNHVFRIRLSTYKLQPVFLNWIVGSGRGKNYFLRSAKQTTGIASINMTQLRNFPLFIPPLLLQQEFARIVTAIEKLKGMHRASLAEMDSLFASLQHRAFRGEL